VIIAVGSQLKKPGEQWISEATELKVLHDKQVHEYEPGTWGPKEADRLTRQVGGWHAPQ